MKKHDTQNFKRFTAIIIGLSIIVLGGCGSKEGGDKATQTLARVDGKEITVHQLNEEMMRANVPPNQQEAAKKQILQSLVDRQLLENEAIKAKVDRDPNVMQAIERAKSQIVAQAYIQSKLASVTKPSKSEVEDYYKKHPEFFERRRMVEMNQLLMDSAQVNERLKQILQTAKSLDDVATALDAANVQYDRGQISRSLAEMPRELSAKLENATRGQLFVIGAGNRTMLIQADTVKNSPVSQEAAAPQIEQFLLNQRRKEAGEAELTRLRSSGKVEYLTKDKPADIPKSEEAKPANDAASTAPSKAGKNSDIERGVSGL